MKRFVAVAVLTVSATTSSTGADCGWLVWQETLVSAQDPDRRWITPQDTDRRWELRGASESFEDCQKLREREITKAMDDLVTLQKREQTGEGIDNLYRDIRGVILVNTPVRAGLRAMEIRTLCLPASFDPRVTK